MASTSRTITHSSASTSGESFLRYEPHSTKLAFQSDKRYHVFLSFRGQDVRKTLVDHLFEALSVAGLNVYKDDENLEKGEEIWPSLKEAINGSAIFIPIFSKGYAESTWCLREAAEMVRANGLIIPLFYYVDPTQVRYPEKENSPYCQSFQKHRRQSGEEIEWWKHALGKIYPCLQLYGHSVGHRSKDIDQWIAALFKICDRSGWSMDIADGKLIGARYFYAGHEARDGRFENGNLATPRDLEGHRSHSLSTSSGNFLKYASLYGYVEGVAKGRSSSCESCSRQSLLERGLRSYIYSCSI